MTAQAIQAVYQVLDDLFCADQVPPGVQGRIAHAIDVLRDEAPQSDVLRLAEEISLEIHKLRWAQHASNSIEMERVTGAFRNLAAGMLNARILN